MSWKYTVVNDQNEFFNGFEPGMGDATPVWSAVQMVVTEDYTEAVAMQQRVGGDVAYVRVTLSQL